MQDQRDLETHRPHPSNSKYMSKGTGVNWPSFVGTVPLHALWASPTFWKQQGCHSHRLNGHSCNINCASWPHTLRKGWSHYTFFCTTRKLNVVNGQSPANQHGQRSKPKKSWSKFWPAVAAEWHPPEQCATIIVSPTPPKCILITSILNINAHFDQTFHFLIKIICVPFLLSICSSPSMFQCLF